MASVVQNMIHGVLGDGARKTKFDCIINFNDIGLFSSEKDIATLIKTSSFPGKTNETIDFLFKGQHIPLKGVNKYDHTWTCTFYLSQDHKLKMAFESWIESLEQVHNKYNVSTKVKNAQRKNNTDGYGTTAQIIQLDFDGTQQTAIYELYNVFPKSVSVVDTDYSAVGAVQEFQVEFSYSYFIAKNYKGALGGFIDEVKDALMGVVNDVVGSVKQQITSTLASGISAIVGGGKTLLSGGNPFAGAGDAIYDSFTQLETGASGMISSFTSSSSPSSDTSLRGKTGTYSYVTGQAM